LSSFVLTKYALETIGFFDENIYPAYYEDSDYWRRIIISGKSHKTINNAIIISGDGNFTNSCTLNSVSEDYRNKMWKCFERNQKYYKDKWGDEKYEYPFNKKNLSIKDIPNHENYIINQQILLQHDLPPIFDVKTVLMNNLISFNWQKYFNNRRDFIENNITDEKKCVIHWIDFDPINW
jgi:hypothetical protein